MWREPKERKPLVCARDEQGLPKLCEIPYIRTPLKLPAFSPVYATASPREQDIPRGRCPHPCRPGNHSTRCSQLAFQTRWMFLYVWRLKIGVVRSSNSCGWSVQRGTFCPCTHTYRRTQNSGIVSRFGWWVVRPVRISSGRATTITPSRSYSRPHLHRM